MITLKFKIGAALIEVDGKTEEDVIAQASFFEELPCECGLCQSKSIGFRHRRTKEYDFYELRCKECKATFALGQKKEGGLYPRGSQEKGREGEWEKEYQREERSDDRGRDREPRRDERRAGREPARERERDDRRAPAGRGKDAPPDDDDIPF